MCPEFAFSPPISPPTDISHRYAVLGAAECQTEREDAKSTFNALQSDSLGTSVGFCTEHKRVLQTPSETTCGKHLRKDLSIESAEDEHRHHEKRFSPTFVALIRTKGHANGGHISAEKADVDRLRDDKVSETVTDFGLLGSKIESLSRLSAMNGVRAHLAMLSLGRTYVRRCNQNQGRWTSGLHLVWWIRKTLPEEPDIALNDIRGEAAIPLSRQVDLARWTIAMFRLIVLSDVGFYARETSDRFRALRSLAEDAAAAGELSFAKLFVGSAKTVSGDSIEHSLSINTRRSVSSYARTENSTRSRNNELSFSRHLNGVVELGRFEVMVGGSSTDVKKTNLDVVAR